MVLVPLILKLGTENIVVAPKKIAKCGSFVAPIAKCYIFIIQVLHIKFMNKEQMFVAQTS